MLPKNIEEFKETLSACAPNEQWSLSLKALWYDANDNWADAHNLVDGSSDVNDKWIHAYLHRKEGDEWNAGYWYRQAGKEFPKNTLEEEHEKIVQFIINQ